MSGTGTLHDRFV